MAVSERPEPEIGTPGNELPSLRTRSPGPESRSWLMRLSRRQAPMGPRRAEAPGPVRADVPGGTIVLASGKGSNVTDVDGNRYVDLAAGFGALLLGHSHEAVLRAVDLQAPRLLQALGDVYPSDAKIGLLERIAELHPAPDAQVILAQSGSDAVSAALKTAALFTGRPGVLAFEGAYHGLGYGPLAACGLRPSYRDPFSEQLNPSVTFAPYPPGEAELEQSLSVVRKALETRTVGAILVEPILGRGGVVVPPASFLPSLGALAKAHGALLIADEIWTGLGRSGRWLFSDQEGYAPDLLCLGKGLGGGLPISACLGPKHVMAAWSREAEVVHTSTFAAAPLVCATSLATLDVLSRHGLVQRAERVGADFRALIATATQGTALGEVRGAGFMLGLDATRLSGGAPRLARALLARGYVTSSGGGARDVLVLTPPLVIARGLLEAFTEALRDALAELS
jgi:4-aminobutyrate aminotransferase/(S)-3-amino-2-methylpropionate transaminase